MITDIDRQFQFSGEIDFDCEICTGYLEELIKELDGGTSKYRMGFRVEEDGRLHFVEVRPLKTRGKQNASSNL
ncbi:unnamed protein product [marine sediment metagenome]|uniref:Uncharacterized protein n=1 Tax=marine sediment metagenome TaxID=412755 RepID=X0VU02_9ZZZZ